MTSLLIGEDGNPIYQKRNWRSYAIYRLEHWGLRYVNNAEVTDDDIFEANQVWNQDFVTCPDFRSEFAFSLFSGSWKVE